MVILPTYLIKIDLFMLIARFCQNLHCFWLPSNQSRDYKLINAIFEFSIVQLLHSASLIIIALIVAEIIRGGAKNAPPVENR